MSDFWYDETGDAPWPRFPNSEALDIEIVCEHDWSSRANGPRPEFEWLECRFCGETREV